MADHPLRPAIHRRLGEPLPHQLPNETRTHLKAEAYAEAPFPSKVSLLAHTVLATVSSRYSILPGRLSTRYSPVRHFTRPRRDFRVRLACVRHAASVQSEPESNSPVKKNMIHSPCIHGEDRTQSSFSLLALHLSKNQNRVPRHLRRDGNMHATETSVKRFLENFFKEGALFI